MLEVVLEFARIHAVCALVDVNKVGSGARLADRLGCSDESVRNGDDNVTRFYAAGSQCESNGVRSAGYADTIRCFTEFRELPFELLDLRPSDEPGCAQGVLQHRH